MWYPFQLIYTLCSVFSYKPVKPSTASLAFSIMFLLITI